MGTYYEGLALMLSTLSATVRGELAMCVLVPDSQVTKSLPPFARGLVLVLGGLTAIELNGVLEWADEMADTRRTVNAPGGEGLWSGQVP